MCGLNGGGGDDERKIFFRKEVLKNKKREGGLREGALEDMLGGGRGAAGHLRATDGKKLKSSNQTGGRK